MSASYQTCSKLTCPVAILDKQLQEANSFRIQIFELCSLCGARFGIGYFGASEMALDRGDQDEQLPRRLIEILQKDHRQQREHKAFIELDGF